MQPPNQNTIDAVMAATGSKATYTGAGVSMSGALLSSEAGVLFGIVLGILGLVINYIFKRREDTRLQQEHDARMRALLQPAPAVTIQGAAK